MPRYDTMRLQRGHAHCTPNKLVRASASMMAHQPHLLDFSSPPNTAILLALHDAGTDMRGGGVVPHRVVADTTSPWPQVSLCLHNAAGGSLVGHQQQPFTAPPSSVAHNLPSTMQPFQLRSSQFLGPVKELLGEFCSLEGDLHAVNSPKRAPKAGKWDDVEASSSSSPWANPSLSAMDLLELERRKARLLSMVEEVDRRYRRYREQMRAVELSFEAVAGAGAAQVYTKLALRAMSRHFRCLRDALVGQIRALRKAMGETDAGGGGVAAAPGATKGDTPRLRVLDQCLRQQRSFLQSGTVESYPWRPQRGLPERAVAILRAWLFEHFLHPYPNDVDKHILARQTGLSRGQVSNWFINARVRLWKPMIEDMYTEETRQQSDGNQNPSGGGGGGKPDHKNTAASTATFGEITHQLRTGNNHPNSLIPSIVADGDQFHSYPSLHGGGGAVSLTLGLQQQPFASSMMQQQPLMLEGEEEEAVLPYRNLMGSQLLHDLAG